MRVRFAAVTQEDLSESASQQASALVSPQMMAHPKTFLEMVLFSVAVSVVTQVVLHFVFRPRYRDSDAEQD
jgi:hypothetical protein